MKHLLLTTIAAVGLVGCATTQSPEPLISKAPDISIHEAVAAGNIEAVKQHLADGADVNATDEVGWTPLFYAAAKTGSGHKEIGELLIASDADVNALSVNGKTPLDLANNEIADLLRKHGGKTGKELRGWQLNQPTPPLERSRVVVPDGAQSCRQTAHVVFFRLGFLQVHHCDSSGHFLWLVCFRFSHQPSVCKAEGFLRQQLKRLENCAQRDECWLNVEPPST